MNGIMLRVNGRLTAVSCIFRLIGPHPLLIEQRSQANELPFPFVLHGPWLASSSRAGILAEAFTGGARETRASNESEKSGQRAPLPAFFFKEPDGVKTGRGNGDAWLQAEAATAARRASGALAEASERSERTAVSEENSVARMTHAPSTSFGG